METPSQCRFSVTQFESLLTQLIPDDLEMRVTIVIDALDECENSGYELLECLKRILRSRPQSVRLLLSSQMHVQVKPFFLDNEIQSIRIHPSRTQDDMRNFVTKEMEKHSRLSLKGILDSDEVLRKAVAKELLLQAKGM